jgi:hypothetical protein
MTDAITIFDYLLVPFYITFILFYANTLRMRKIYREGKLHYRYLMPALVCKMTGAIALPLVYTYYYTQGGDVVNYFVSARTYSNVLLEGHFDKFAQMLDYKSNNIHFLLSYDNIYGFFLFAPNDYYALFTVILTIPLCLLGCNSFLCTAVLLASLSLIGIWKLYEVFIDQFPGLSREFAITFFFVPSVFFWGSGILKDTYTLASIGFFISGMYHFQIRKERKIRHLLAIVGASIVFIYIKPYFLFALFPGTLLWILFYKIQNLKNQVVRALAIPMLLLVMVSAVLAVFQYLGTYLGEYSLEHVLHKAVKTQQDLIRSAYGTNSYDIGKFDPTIPGVIGKAPAALNLALFRPYIWDARNAVMLISAIENMFMLGFSLYILFRVRFSVLLNSLQSHPLLVFSFLFAIFFAFSVGLTTANYGALSRLRIPCLPFYMASLFILYHLNKQSFMRRSKRIQLPRFEDRGTGVPVRVS